MTALILQKIHAIQRDMPMLRKDGTGPSAQGSYKFLAVDDILAAVVPLMNEHGVVVRPVLTHRESEVKWAADGPLPEQWSGRVPKVSIREVVEYTFIFTAIEDGSEFVVSVSGEAMDSQDKATRKAVTSAKKIALIETFQIITGEPDLHETERGAERDGDDAPPKKTRQEQMADKARPTAKTTAPPAAPKAEGDDSATDEPIDAVKRDLRKAMGELGMKAAELNAIGSAITGKDKDVWLKSAFQLRKVVKVLGQPEELAKYATMLNTGEVPE